MPTMSPPNQPNVCIYGSAMECLGTVCPLDPTGSSLIASRPACIRCSGRVSHDLVEQSKGQPGPIIHWGNGNGICPRKASLQSLCWFQSFDSTWELHVATKNSQLQNSSTYTKPRVQPHNWWIVAMHFLWGTLRETNTRIACAESKGAIYSRHDHTVFHKKQTHCPLSRVRL